MNQLPKNNAIPPHHLKRLHKIGMMLREIRLSEGYSQTDLLDFGVTRRQIQRRESGSNLSLVSLFKLLDAYGYHLNEFFNGME
jgi:transcriptional regulator with XRE-family HTH domain